MAKSILDHSNAAAPASLLPSDAKMRNPRAGVMGRLPRGDQAIVDIHKIENYCLDPLHRRGRHKARVFQAALDLQPGDAGWLRDALLAAA